MTFLFSLKIILYNLLRGKDSGMIKILTFQKCLIMFLGIFSSMTSFADGMLPEDLPHDKAVDESVIELNINDQQIYSDPFKRGVTRSPAYATFGEELASDSSRIDDLRHLQDLRYYRVVGVVGDEELQMPKILELGPDDFFGDEHQGYYVKVQSKQDIADIRTVAKNLMVNYRKNLNRYLIIRFNEKNTLSTYNLEYGPFRTKEITVAHCHYLAALTKNEQMSCSQVHQRYVSDQEKMATQNTATVGLSQFALLDFKEKPYEFSLEKLKKMTLEVTIDQLLGPHGFVITHINEDGISVTGLSGNAMFIPVSTFPINIEGSSAVPPASPTPAGN